MNADTLLDAINKAIEDKQDLTGRSHLGASLIGHECGRYLWYSFRWAFKEKFSGRMLRLFERGQLEEKRFITYLTDAGATVYEEDPSTGKQWRILDVDGHFGGSTDGVAINLPQLALGVPCVLEMKTHNDKSFTLLAGKVLAKTPDYVRDRKTAQGLQKSKPTHYVQLQTYMFKLGVGVGLYLAVNKDTDEIYAEFIALDPACGERAINRARSIIYSDEPPPRIKQSIGWFPCSFCSMREICHLTKTPAVNCRTCCHATPVADGKWDCARGKAEIEVAPDVGCTSHLFNPHMLNIGQVVAGDTEANWLTLIRQDGSEVTTGPNHVTSHNLTL